MVKTQKKNTKKQTKNITKSKKSSKKSQSLRATTETPANLTRVDKYTYFKKSSIHGKGCFAKCIIKKGTYIGRYAGPRNYEDDIYVLWIHGDEKKPYGIDGRNTLRYLNHSSKPNVEFDGDRLYSLCKIETGSELTFHYGEEWNDVE